MAVDTIHEIYTDAIDEQGITKRIRFFLRVTLDTGETQWHYFGVDPAVRPPKTADPVFEHPFVRIPQGLDDLDSQESSDVLFKIARMIGLRQAGLTNPSD